MQKVFLVIHVSYSVLLGLLDETGTVDISVIRKKTKALIATYRQNRKGNEAQQCPIHDHQFKWCGGIQKATQVDESKEASIDDRSAEND